MGVNTCRSACWIRLSFAVGIPNSRFGFKGIITQKKRKHCRIIKLEQQEKPAALIYFKSVRLIRCFKESPRLMSEPVKG